MTATPSPPLIAVTGHGRVAVRPDRTQFTLELRVLAPEINTARRELDSRRAAVREALARVRVGECEVSSDGPAWEPNYTCENQAWNYAGIAGCETVTVEFLRSTLRDESLLLSPSRVRRRTVRL